MRNSKKQTRKRADAGALILLVLAVLVLFLPVLVGRSGIFHDDLAMAEFPWHFFLARHIQNGIVPRWEPDTWCGAIPFYARYYADTWYFPYWPFYLLSRLDDLDQSCLMISTIPLLLHYCLAAIGMYFFARRGIRLRPLSAFVTAWVYLFSPAFSYSYVWSVVVHVQAWLPWLLLIVVALDRGLTWGKIAGGGIIIALMLFAAQPPHVGYSMLLSGFLALGLGLRRLSRGRKALFFRAPLGLALATLLGLALSAVFWLSALEGDTHAEQHLPRTYEGMTGADGSAPPLYLATLFVPDLFGTVNGFNSRNWVESVTQGVRFWDANLSGGLLLTFLALGGVFLVRNRLRPGRLRFWAIFAAGIWVFSILCVLGRHTPFYRIFYEIVPGLSLFPFPIRYRLLQVVAAAILAGLGTEYLLAGDKATDGWPRKLVWGYLALAALTFPAALAGKEGVKALLRGRLYLPGLEEILRRDALDWFLGGPVLYFLGAAFCLAAVWRIFRGRERAAAAAALVMLETFILAWAAFYFCIFRFDEPKPQQRRSRSPSTHPMIERVVHSLAAFREDPTLRWATDQPFHDNFARLEGSFAFMGYDMKPLERRFRRAFADAYGTVPDWPIYWDFPRPESGAFLSNMSVETLLDSRSENLFPGGETIPLGSEAGFYLHRNPRPLPRAFALDRIVLCSEEEASRELTQGDLRRAVFIEEPLPTAVTDHGLRITNYASLPPSEPDKDYARFAAIQADSPVTRLDFSDPNRVEIEVEIFRPAMLVLTEAWYPGWKAQMDGQPAELHRVNYLQRGIVLPRGEHRVELVFHPRAWRIGLTVTGLSWALLLLVGLGRVGWKCLHQTSCAKEAK